MSTIDDLRIGLRNLARRPGATVAAVAILALGVAAVTTVWSVADLALMRPAHAAQPDRLINVHAKARDGSSFHSFSYPDYRALRDDEAVAGLAAWSTVPTSLSIDGPARLALGQIVSENYFDVFGVRPSLGRFFEPAEVGPPGAHPVVVVGHGLWQHALGGDPEALGRTIAINGHPFTVIGVAPPDFGGPMGVVDTDLWMPLAMQAQAAPTGNLDTETFVWLEIVGRLADGVDDATAIASLDHRGRAAMEASGRTFHGLDATPVGMLPGIMRGPLGLFVGLLMAAVGLILAITSANVGGMLLGRAVERRGEVAVRLALGASRARLARLLLGETLLLFAFGGALGIALASVALRLIPTIDFHLPVALNLDLPLDGRAIAVSIVTALVTGLLFGWLPTLRATRPDIAQTMASSAGRGTARARGRSAFVIAQVAGSFVLLVAAGLLVRALTSAATTDPGFATEGVWVSTIDLSLGGYDESTAPAVRRRILEHLDAEPSVAHAGAAQIVPLTLANSTTAITVEGFEAVDDSGHPVDANVVDGAYFDVLQIPLLAGRRFGDQDHADSAAVTIINRTLAERLWGTSAAVGQRITASRTSMEVVGVVGDAFYRSLGEAPRPMIFRPASQRYRAQMALHAVAHDGAPSAQIGEAIRRAIASVDQNIPVLDLRTLEDATAISLLPQRIVSRLTAALGALGAVLAALGIFGLVSFTVAQRTREMGLRMALGAGGSAILRLVLRGGLRLAGMGVGIGVIGALAVSRLLQGLLLGAEAATPFFVAIVAVGLTGVALVASLAPALRACRIPPSVALRDDG